VKTREGFHSPTERVRNSRHAVNKKPRHFHAGVLCLVVGWYPASGSTPETTTVYGMPADRAAAVDEVQACQHVDDVFAAHSFARSKGRALGKSGSFLRSSGAVIYVICSVG
jgi:hypothetical protein